MQRSLPGILRGLIGVRAPLQQELAKPPMSVVACAPNTQIFAERPKACTMRNEKPNRADIPVVSTMLHQ